jgi:hypothetical protein
MAECGAVSLEELAAIHAAAPKGPYTPANVGSCFRYVGDARVTEDGYWIPEVEYLGNGESHAMPESAARFIAAAYVAFPWLIERAKAAAELEASNAGYVAALDDQHAEIMRLQGEAE